MNEMVNMLKELLTEYSEKLKVVEKEIVRKYKSGEDFKKELTDAKELKALQQETVIMMKQYLDK